MAPLTKRPKLTPSTQKHRFEPFSQRISNLKVKPIRLNAQDKAHTDLRDEQSHFRIALEEWQERNMSTPFVSLAQEVEPLCQNLPQVIHYEAQIVDHLLEWLPQGNIFSLEPMLHLVVQLAYDIGQHFHAYFDKIVRAVSRLAAISPDVEVVEWSFNCLAALFKHLERFLVLDLRPLYSILAPLMGRERQKAFVCRFTAQALSFLVRKMATAAGDAKPNVDAFVSHVFRDLEATSSQQSSHHQRSIMTMFTDALKGVQGGLRNGAEIVLSSLLDMTCAHTTGSIVLSDLLQETVWGVLTALVHHSNAEGFAPALQVILDFAEANMSKEDTERSFCANTLFIAIAVRKATRVQNSREGSWADWVAVNRLIELFIKSVNESPSLPSSALLESIQNLLAVFLQYCPPEHLLLAVPHVEHISKGYWQQGFLRFCVFACDLGAERFNQILRKQLELFVVRNWAQEQNNICVALLHFPQCESVALAISGLDSAKEDYALKMQLTVDAFETKSPVEESLLYVLRQYMDIFRDMEISTDTSTSTSHYSTRLILAALNPGVANANPVIAALALCKALNHIEISCLVLERNPDTCAGLIRASKDFKCHLGYLHAMQKLLPELRKAFNGNDTLQSEFVNALIGNLASSNAGLRMLSLQILTDICETQNGAVPEALKIAAGIEHSSFDFNSLRPIALSIRKLGQSSMTAGVAWLGRAITSYLFGLLHVRLTPLWSDVCNSLETMSENADLQVDIMNRCMDWLHSQSQDVEPSLSHEATDSLPPVERTTEFQCTNLMQVKQISEKSTTCMNDVPKALKVAFDADVGTAPVAATGENRAQSLRVLCKLSATAEKYSRLLVPVFLDWFRMNGEAPDLDTESDDDETSTDQPFAPRTTTSRASRDSKKSVLTLFSSFVNPRVLYRSDEVYESLMHQLCSGDSDVQRLALRAIFAWKSPATRPYEENLLNLLDEASFRNELTVFLAIGQGDNVIRADHLDDLLPVLMRLLYGRSIARSKARGGQTSRRQAILLSLARLGHQAVGQFIQIALQPLDSLKLLSGKDGSQLNDNIVDSRHVSPRMQLGYLKMIRAILHTLPNLIVSFVVQLFEVVLLCLVRCSEQYDGIEEQVVEHESLVKHARLEGLKCLELLFRHGQQINWRGYVPTLLEKVVVQRIEQLPIETAQGVSTTLRLISTWASSPHLTYILLDNRTPALVRAAECLEVPSALDEVKAFVLKDIIGELLELVSSEGAEDHVDIGELAARLRGGLAGKYLDHISRLIASRPSKAILELGIDTIARLSPFLADSSQVDGLVVTVLGLLGTDIKGIPPHLRSRLLSVLEQYLPKSRVSKDEEQFDKGVYALSVLFSYFLDAPSRTLLARVFGSLVTGRPDFATPALLCQQLNAWSSSRLEEPDFDARLEAIDVITSGSRLQMDARHWRPVIHNMLYLLKDDAHFSSVRTGASEGLQSFLRATSKPSGEDREERAMELVAIIDRDILPAVCRGMREASEPIRLEYLKILAELVSLRHSSTEDMLTLLGSNSDKSFFDGILHIQQSQRLSALRLLAHNAHNISSSNLSRIFLPLMETIIGNSEEGSQAVTDDAIKAFDALAGCLEWVKYRYMLQRMVAEKSRFESKQAIRVLAAAVNALHRAHKQKKDGLASVTALAQTLPSEEMVAKGLSKGCLAQLLEYTHFKDESTVGLRIIVAAIAVKVIMTFPPELIDAHLPPVLMDLCNVLKSKAQEARDAARKTLADISAVIGASYFGFVIKQLRSSLQRGTQLHVMSYTIHSLLVVVAPIYAPGDLDYCLQDLMTVIVDDVFGGVSQDKESQGFTSKMTEVRKKALGYDSLELLASFTTPQRAGVLIRPIKSHLEKSRPKLEKCDELLRRLQEGFRRNERFNDRQALTLCYEMLRDGLQTEPNATISALPSHYKLAAFALSLLRRTIDKHEILKTRDTLQSFIPLMTQILSVGETTSMEAALRVFTSIIKLPIAELDQDAGKYLNLARRILESDSSTLSQLAQSSLRLVSSLLRERPNALIKRSDFQDTIAYMLKRITPDLREPAHSHERGRQTGAYNLLKAALGRGVLINEVYEIMDTVREVMVTSPEPEIRSSARSVYCRFVVDYFPDEGKGFVKQMVFLKGNLQYEHVHGRISVMEVVDHLLYKTKGTDKSAQSLISRFWEALLDLLVTDPVAQGRDAARLLLVKLFECADEDRTLAISQQLSKLCEPGMADLVQTAGYRGWHAYFEVNTSANQEASITVNKIYDVIKIIDPKMKRSKARLVEDILETYTHLCERFSGISLGMASPDIWAKICSASTMSAHLGVRQASLQLIKVYYDEFARTSSPRLQQQGLPLIGFAASQLDRSKLLRVIDSSTLVFREDFEPVLAARASEILTTVSLLPYDDRDRIKILSQILSRLSGVIRQEDTSARAKLVALKLLMSIAEGQSNETLQPTMQEMLMILANLTDTAIASAFGEEETHEQLGEVAQAFLDVLKAKLGPNEFIRQFQSVQTAVRERREERKAKRSIQTVNQPEQAGKEKIRKGAAKRGKRKERNEAFAGRRRGY